MCYGFYFIDGCDGLFRKITLFLIVLLFLGIMNVGISFADDFNEGVPSVPAFKENVDNKTPKISAGSAIVLDVKSGRVLYEKNSYTKEEIASTTKIMTAIIAIENGNLEEEVTISKRAASVWGSSIDLRQGEKLKLKELLYGLMLNSGNDAAIAIAEHIGGSVENFVELMNKKAIDLGTLSTSFKSPHGLDMPDHYSTAYDLALITRYALNNPTFAKIVATKSIQITKRNLYNTNEMLGFYPGADGVKTGYTGMAGRCLVTSVSRDDRKIIAVVLNCATRNIRAQNSKDILDYAFKNYKPYLLTNAQEVMKRLPVKRGIKEGVEVETVDRVELPLTMDEFAGLETKIELPEELQAPVYEGIEIGEVQYCVDGKVIAKTALKTKETIRRKGATDYLKELIFKWAETIREL